MTATMHNARVAPPAMGAINQLLLSLGSSATAIMPRSVFPSRESKASSVGGAVASWVSSPLDGVFSLSSEGALVGAAVGVSVGAVGALVGKLVGSGETVGEGDGAAETVGEADGAAETEGA